VAHSALGCGKTVSPPSSAPCRYMSTVATRCEFPNGSTCTLQHCQRSPVCIGTQAQGTYRQRALLEKVGVVAIALALLIAQHLQALLVFNRYHSPGSNSSLYGCYGGRLSGAEKHAAAAPCARRPHRLKRDRVNDHGGVEPRLREPANLGALLSRQEAAPQERAVGRSARVSPLHSRDNAAARSAGRTAGARRRVRWAQSGSPRPASPEAALPHQQALRRRGTAAEAAAPRKAARSETPACLFEATRFVPELAAEAGRRQRPHGPVKRTCARFFVAHGTRHAGQDSAVVVRAQAGPVLSKVQLAHQCPRSPFAITCLSVALRARV
jgi:hypothetical protein